MSHGAPDDSNIVKRGDAYRLDDMAELAVRLGSAVTFHRFGTVIWMETFSGGLGNCVVGVTSSSCAVYLQSDRFHQDGIAAELNTLASTPEYASLNKFGPYYPGSVMAYSGWYCCLGEYNVVQINLEYYDGDYTYYARIKVLHPTGDVTYLNNSYAEVALGNVGLVDADGVKWYPFKLVVNTQLHEYVRFMFADVVFDMSGIALYSTAISSAAYVQTAIRLFSPTASDRSVYVDDLVFTLNEEV